MNHILKYIIIATSFVVFLSNMSYAQADCKEIVYEALHHKFDHEQSNVNLVYKVGTRLTGRDSTDYQTITSNVTQKYTTIETGDLTYLRDEQVSVTIRHDVKKVFVTGGKGMSISELMDGFISIYDTLIQNSVQTSCSELCIDSKDQVTVDLTIPQPYRDAIQIKNVSYTILDNRLKSFEVYYTPSYMLSMFSMEIHKWESIPENTQPKREFLAILNDPINKVRSMYPDYKLTDNRNQR